MAAVYRTRSSGLRGLEGFASSDYQRGDALPSLSQNAYPFPFREEAASDVPAFTNLDSHSLPNAPACARTVRFASGGGLFRSYSPVRTESPALSPFGEFPLPSSIAHMPPEGRAASNSAIQSLWQQMPSTSDAGKSENLSTTTPTQASRAESTQRGGTTEASRSRSGGSSCAVREARGGMSLAEEFRARGGYPAESRPFNHLTSYPASTTTPSPGPATRPRNGVACKEPPLPVGSDAWWATSNDRTQVRTSQATLEGSSSFASRGPPAASASAPPDRSDSPVGPATVFHSAEGPKLFSSSGDTLPPDCSTVSGRAATGGGRGSPGKTSRLDHSYPNSESQGEIPSAGSSSDRHPVDLLARQAQLQRQMQALQKRQRELVSQQAQQLHRQQMRRPWLVPCALTPNAERLATLTIIPARDAAGVRGNSSRCGSCPIFSRCGGGERSRSASARASRPRRIGVYVQPSPAPCPSVETGPADEVTCRWNCSSPDAGPGSPGLPTEDSRSTPDNRMLLRLQVVPPPEPEQHRPREPQKEEETAPKKEAKKTPAEEGPDEVKEQLLRENTILREENLALKAQLERLQGEESSRHYARIEAHRRLQKDELGGGALMQELEEENLKLRRQVADLGSALYKVSEDGNFQTATEILVGQLLDAHKELSTLKKALRHEKHLADAAQTGVAGVLKMMDRGKEVFASDPNDISVQQAALDSLLSQGKRLTAKAREGVWTALSSMKDLIDQTFDRVTRLLNSSSSLDERKKYLQDLHVLVVSSLDDTLQAYDELDATCSSFEKIRAVVFDPKRNSPYWPRRQVLEDDLKHLTVQMKEASERIRQLRCRVVKLEMENLFFYVQQEPDTVSPKGALTSRSPAKGRHRSPTTEVPPPVAGRCQKTRKARSQRGSPAEKAAVPASREEAGDSQPPKIEEKRKPERQTKLVLTRHREELLPEEKGSDEVSRLQFTSAIQKLQDEIDRLKDERQFDHTKSAERAQFLTHRIFACNKNLVDKLEEEDRLLERLVEAIEARELQRDRAQPVTPHARVERRHLQEDIEESRALIRQSSAALREGQSLTPQTMERLVTRLMSLKPLKSSESMSEEELELVRMINAQAAQLRKLHEEVNELRDGSF